MRDFIRLFFSGMAFGFFFVSFVHIFTDTGEALTWIAMSIASCLISISLERKTQ